MKNRMLLVTVAIKSEKDFCIKINITCNISCKCNLLLWNSYLPFFENIKKKLELETEMKGAYL